MARLDPPPVRWPPAIFGVATAAMNICFYMALDRTDLGKSVTMEFIGPIAVAAAMTRTTRNALALALAAGGVIVLGGVEIGDNTVGAAVDPRAHRRCGPPTSWSARRVAQIGRGVAGLGIGPRHRRGRARTRRRPSSGPILSEGRLLVLCLLVGVLSNAIGYGIDQHVLRRIPVRRFSLLLALLPVTALLFGWIALDQTPSALDLVGIAFVLAGVALQERDEIPSSPMPEPS